jgi:hypothetical protein
MGAMDKPFKPGFRQMELRFSYRCFLHVLCIVQFENDVANPHELAFLDENPGNPAGELWSELYFGSCTFNTTGSANQSRPVIVGIWTTR